MSVLRSTLPGVDPGRVAEVLVDLGSSGRRRGSGYEVRPGVVLTAAHVVRSAAVVRVRFDADRPSERVLTAGVAWLDDRSDVAVVTFDSGVSAAPAPFAGIVDSGAVIECAAVGFPRFKLREDTAHLLPDGRPALYRDMCQATGTSAVLSNRREGTLEIVVSPPERDPDPRTSPWEGMSGSAVWSEGHIVGLISEHHRSDGLGRLAATRVDRWFETVSDDRLAELVPLVGLPPRQEQLSTLPSRPIAGWAPVAYRAQVLDIAPHQLSDRADELDELTRFCAGDETYLWWQGPPWAGKTALAAWLVLHPPAGVTVVSFFITGRMAGQADGDAFTATMVDQLAAVAGTAPAAAATAGARDAERRRLLAQAAERVAAAGQRLLVVIDGLDEDQGYGPGGGQPSIASLLPRRPHPAVRVFVTSRPHPGLPMDVPADHPLRHCRSKVLAPSGAAQLVEVDAKRELFERLHGDDLEREIVSFTTASGGGLTVAELATLTGQPGFTVTTKLTSAFGRSLNSRGSTDSAGESRYLFAHEALRISAEDELEPELAGYRDRLHRWASVYRDRGWPADTPGYLLQPYARLLRRVGEPQRLAELIADPRRQELMLTATYSDSAGLAEIAAAEGMLPGHAPDDLRLLAILAVARDRLLRRGRALPARLAGTWAALGQPVRGEALARALPDVEERIWALADVACSPDLDEADSERLTADAEWFVRQDPRLTGSSRSEFDPTSKPEWLRRKPAAVYATEALARSGAYARAERLASDLTDPSDRSAAWLAIFAAARPTEPARALNAASLAMVAAEEATTLDDRVSAFTSIAVTLRGTDPIIATEAANRAAQIALTATPGSVPTTQGISSTLDEWKSEPGAYASAAMHIESVIDRLRTAAEGFPASTDPVLEVAARAAAQVHRFDHQILVECALGDPASRDPLCAAIAQSFVSAEYAAQSETVLWNSRRSRADDESGPAVARALLARGLTAEARMVIPGTGRPGACARVLAEAGPAEAAEQEAQAIGDVAARASVLAILAARHAAVDPIMAERVAAEAEHLSRDVPIDYWAQQAVSAALSVLQPRDDEQPAAGRPAPIERGTEAQPGTWVYGEENVARVGRLATAGDLATSLTIAYGFTLEDDAARRARALAAVVPAALVHDRSLAHRLVREALNAAGWIPDPLGQASALKAVIVACALLDRPLSMTLVDRAERLTELGPNSPERVQAMMGLAVAAGDLDRGRAVRLIRAAERIRRELGPVDLRAPDVCVDMARSMILLGLREFAEDTVRTYADVSTSPGAAWQAADALAAVAVALASDPVPAGELLDQPRRIAAELLRDPSQWTRALQILVLTDPTHAQAICDLVLADSPHTS